MTESLITLALALALQCQVASRPTDCRHVTAQGSEKYEEFRQSGTSLDGFKVRAETLPARVRQNRHRHCCCCCCCQKGKKR